MKEHKIEGWNWTGYPPPLKWGVAILLKCTLKSSQINYNAAALLLVTNSVVDKI